MGTSQSSDGSPSGVPMVPPWVPDPPPFENSDQPPVDEGELNPAPASAPLPPVMPPVPIAPAGRFKGARTSLGGFARTGDVAAMRRGVGHYIRNGYGGSATAVRRFGGTASTAGALYRALSGGAAGQGQAPGNALDPILLAGRSARELIDAVIEVVRPVDGTQDAEADRAAIGDALSELLSRFPDADVLNLTEAQRALAIERFVAMDVFRRLDLDLGKTFREKAPSAVTALSRLKQVKDYVKETVAASFRKLRDAGRRLTAGNIGNIVRSALLDTFRVFEGYTE
jgi:hypothetical protein